MCPCSCGARLQACSVESYLDMSGRRLKPTLQAEARATSSYYCPGAFDSLDTCPFNPSSSDT